MAYEMKGHTLPGIKQKNSDKTKDGRPGSSAFQLSKGKQAKLMVEQGFGPAGMEGESERAQKKHIKKHMM